MARVLIIDDSPSVVKKVERVLEPAGHDVETLDLIIQLPNLVRDDPPDAILLDLSMPTLSGVNVGSFIRLFQKTPIPIIVYSSRPEDELQAAVREVGAIGYVHKDEPDGRLRSAIAHAVSGRGSSLQTH